MSSDSYLTEMSTKELKQLAAKVDLLLTTKTAKKDLTLWDEFFYRCIESILYNRLHQTIPPLMSLKAKKTRRLYNLVKETREYIDSWTKSVLKRRVSRAEIIKVYTLYVDLIIEYLTGCGAPIYLRTILLQHDKFPGIFDRAFPGYLSTNSFLFILNSKYQDIRLTED